MCVSIRETEGPGVSALRRHQDVSTNLPFDWTIHGEFLNQYILQLILVDILAYRKACANPSSHSNSRLLLVERILYGEYCNDLR
jgi:hypothetical protein